VHEEALTPTVANKFHELNADSDLEILPAPAVEEPYMLQITSSEDMVIGTEQKVQNWHLPPETSSNLGKASV
jgi:hypothetical protein